ncbi:hypothetical protein SAMN02745225_01185 [Ferrithrix thermotolerans DSM 19514]|uniref:Uncharacterized protein n=2 Tax=Ferrithrix TaxID=643949 RepID=A0A1M4V4Y1_9ACTN|nr:hypothetical protein SAMN02745225_01185 [Ferrithrix thermotolerans DSM 19514]
MDASIKAGKAGGKLRALSVKHSGSKRARQAQPRHEEAGTQACSYPGIASERRWGSHQGSYLWRRLEQRSKAASLGNH